MPQRQYNNLTSYRLLHVVRNSPFYEEYGQTGYDKPFELEVPEGWRRNKMQSGNIIFLQIVFCRNKGGRSI